MKYKFSAPMPYFFDDVKKIISINNQVERSEIKNLYFALPYTSIDNTGFEQLRTTTKQVEKFENFIPHIEYIKSHDLDFIYLLNSPKPLLFESKFLEKQLEKLDIIVNKLRNLDCNKYRVCNPQLLAYLHKSYPDLELYASTSLEYQNIKQYSNLLDLYPYIKEMVPAVDLNKNFAFLKSFKKLYPNIRLELMVNEGCMYACPLRMTHNLTLPYRMYKREENDNIIELNYMVKTCNKYVENNLDINICNKNIIYPWEIEEYNNIGITDFKLVGRNIDTNSYNNYIDYYLLYLKGIDDYNNIKNIPIKFFNHYLVHLNVNYTVEEIKDYLPNIEYFKKNGHLCPSICGAECNYCRECAKKIQHIHN